MQKRSVTANVLEDLGAVIGEVKPRSISQASKTLEHLSHELRESYILYDRAQEFLKPHRGYMSEAQAKELIHKTEIPTFPRPEGIPHNYLVKISGKGAGLKYVDPANSSNSVRVMPGKLHSPLPHQQKPYIIEMKNGKAFDKYGNLIEPDLPAAHIPIEEYVYKGEIKKIESKKGIDHVNEKG